MSPPAGPPPASFDVVVLVAMDELLEVSAAVLAGLPTDLPVAVLISGTSATVDEFHRRIRLPVEVVDNGIVLQPGRVYVSPPGAVLEVQPDGSCVLTRREAMTVRLLDRLLLSLAENFGPRALAIILAGSGRDGVAGAYALRGAGGTVWVQDPAFALPAALPRAVVGAGEADLVLPPNGLASTVADLLASRRVPPPSEETAERRAERIIERMGDAYCVLDRDFHIRSVNAAAERLLGRPRDALIGRSHWEAFPASVDAPVGRAFRRVVAEGVEQHFTHHYTSEGYDLHLEVDAYPTEEGGVAMFWRDVTERVKALATLQASEAKYRALFTKMDEAYAVVEVIADAQGSWTDFLFLDANPAFMQHAGMPYPVGRTATELLGTPNPRWAELYGQVAGTGEAIRVEESELTLGRVFDLNIFRLGGEGSRRIAVLFTDITERKRAEDVLRESAERRAFLLTFSDALRLETDADGVAHRAIKMLAEELALDRCYITFYRPDDDAADFPYQVGNDSVPPLPDTVRLSDFPGAYEQVRGQTFVLNDDFERQGLSEAERANSKALGMRAMVASTARRGEKNPLSSLVAMSARPRRWTPGEVALVEEVAERTWAAMNQAQAEVQRRQAEELNAFLVRFTDAVRAVTDPWAVAEVACRLVTERLGVERCYWAEVDWRAREYVIGASVHAPGVPVIEGRFPVGAWEPFTSLHLAGQPVVVDDTQADARIPPEVKVSYAQIAVGADLAVPVVVGGTLRCTLAANQRRARPWTEAEVALVRGIAGRCWSEVERARAEAAVRASQAQFRAVANLVPDLLWESRPDGFTAWYNGRWLEYTGQTFEEASGWGWIDVIHPEDRERSAQRYREAVQGGQLLRQEHRIRRHDGEYRWFVVQTFPFRNEHGEVVQVYSAATDIHHLRERSSVLEARVEERTRRLADLNAELGNLIIRTAHNLEEPARTLGHLLDPGRPVDPHALDGLSPYDPATLDTEVKRLRGIAQDLRQLSRLETHTLTKDLLPLGEVFADIQTQVAATPRGQKMHWFIQPLPIVRGDRALLTQALDVLMTFTLSETRGARHVTVSSRTVEGEVQVTVEDDGIGLSGEEAATLFDLAVRTDQAVPVLEGSGLVQVRRILARHGGWAWAESQRSSGKVVLAFPRDAEVTELEGLFRQDNPGQ